ncbi:hypothetical protein [Cerasicoccus fimbriatus]|uniref:hypothetical protein n=1 Tax=Cerasicoccus fimbriatus TaxID=3014554 RepID=UPI0022B54EF3|nr:hypothetical protein [Cerasicoccus sp. TK19100]
MLPFPRIPCFIAATLTLTTALCAEMAREISQYGITWKFDKPHEVGQFVSGDYWVVGPVTIVSVSPEPGPSDSDAKDSSKSIYGATANIDDKRMRNGSMVNPGKDVSLEQQGLDSRNKSYNESLSVTFPLELKPADILVSSVSSEKYDDKGKLATPDVLGEQKIFYTKAKGDYVVESAALLTCVAQAPAKDAFRPPYAGSKRPVYYARDIKWDKLPNLPAPKSMPKWETYERVHERPWLEIPSSWLVQYFGPSLNGNGYGREVSRMNNMATLMLMTDAPQQQKEKLMYEMIQRGIDLRGVVDSGRVFFADGGWWQGRKWPIMFAGIMLEEPSFYDWPAMPAGDKRVRPSKAAPHPTVVFQEDLDTYYGKGAEGQDVLWQMCWHSGPKPPYQEKPESKWDKNDKRSNGYCLINSTTYVGTALSALLMGAKADWNHDAFFDYTDYWMSDENFQKFPNWLPGKRTADPFVEDMWAMYRDKVPAQANGKDNWKFVWVDMNKRIGEWVENPKP